MRTFSVVIDGNTETLLHKAKSIALEHGALLAGDSRSGSISASGVNGEYNVIGSTVSITITKKPLYVPWSMVEKRVKEFFHP